MKLSLSLLLILTLTAADTRQFSTKLKITVLDDLGSFVPEAVVRLYKAEADYRSSTDAVATDTTNAKGKVVFKELDPVTYFMEVTKGDKSNDGHGVQTPKLLKNKTNLVNTVIY